MVNQPQAGYVSPGVQAQRDAMAAAGHATTNTATIPTHVGPSPNNPTYNPATRSFSGPGVVTPAGATNVQIETQPNPPNTYNTSTNVYTSPQGFSMSVAPENVAKVANQFQIMNTQPNNFLPETNPNASAQLQATLMSIANQSKQQQFNPNIAQQDFLRSATFQPKSQTLDLVSPFSGVPNALYQAWLGQPTQLRNEMFPNYYSQNSFTQFGASLIAGGAYVGEGLVAPFLQPSQFFSGIANQPVESLVTLGSFAIIGGIKPEGGIPQLKSFEPLRGLVSETPDGLNLITSTRARTGGLIGREFEITSSQILKDVNPDLFRGNDFLKLRSAVERELLPKQASENYLRIGAGTTPLQLPENITNNVFPQPGTDLILRDAQLAKLGKNTGSSTGGVFGAPESVGEPFDVSSEGFVRVREVGYLERLRNAIGIPKQLDFTSQVEAAQLAGIKFGETKSFEGLSFGLVQQRDILAGESGELGFSAGGYNQPKIDITRLPYSEVKLLEEDFGLSKPRKATTELGEFLGRIRIEREFARQANQSFSLSGTKGSVTNVDILRGTELIKVPRYAKLFDLFSPRGKLFKEGYLDLVNETETRSSSGVRGFKTQDLTVKFGKKTFKASRIKVEGYPMESKLLFKEPLKEKASVGFGKQFSTKQTRRLQGGNEVGLLESEQGLLSAGETVEKIPQSKSVDVFKGSDVKPFNSKDLDRLGSIGSSIAIQRGGALLTQVLEKQGQKTVSGGLTETIVRNVSRSGAGAALLTKTETKTTTKTAGNEKVLAKQKPAFGAVNSLGVDARFASFATVSTIQSQRVSSGVKQVQNVNQGQSQGQFQGQAQVPSQVQSQSPVQAQVQSQSLGQAQKQGQSQTQTAQQVKPFSGYNFAPPNISSPRFNFSMWKNDDSVKGKFKNLVKGFIPEVRKKGKFVPVGNEVLPKGLAYTKAADVARATLSRSITVKESTQLVEVPEGPMPLLMDFRAPKGKSKLKGNEPIFVQTNPLSTASEKKEIQQAKHLKKMLGRF